MRNEQAITQSQDELPNSATAYRPVNLASVDYAPDTPFKGLHISGDGNLTIEGIDGAQATMAVVAGVFPFGGRKIIRGTTTATGITALF